MVSEMGRQMQDDNSGSNGDIFLLYVLEMASGFPSRWRLSSDQKKREIRVLEKEEKETTSIIYLTNSEISGNSFLISSPYGCRYSLVRQIANERKTLKLIALRIRVETVIKLYRSDCK